MSFVQQIQTVIGNISFSRRKEMRGLSLGFIALFLGLAHLPLPAQEIKIQASRTEPVASSAGAVTVDDFSRQVLASNRKVEAARLKWEAMRERPQIVSSLPDPVASYGYFFSSVETRDGTQNQKFDLSQKFPFPGKLSLAAEKARQEAEMAFWEYQTLAREQILRAKLAYYDLYRVRQMRAILNGQIELLRQASDTARAHYESGTVSQEDVLKAQLTITGIEDKLLALNGVEASDMALLNQLRNATNNPPIQMVSRLELPPLPSIGSALARAQSYRQELQAENVAIQRDRTAVKLAQADRLPDISLGVDYIQVNRYAAASTPDNGKDAVMGYVSINLPIWFGKLDAEERMAKKDLASSEANAQDVANTVEDDVRSAWSDAQATHDQAELFQKSLLPQAQQTFESSQANYQNGKASLLDLLDSERSLLDLQLGLLNSRTEEAKALAELERAVGMDLSRISPRK